MSDPQKSTRTIDHIFLICVTVVVLAVIVAIVVLDVSNHSADVAKYAELIVNAIAGLSTLGIVQSARRGIGQTNNSLNGNLDARIEAAVARVLSQQNKE